MLPDDAGTPDPSSSPSDLFSPATCIWCRRAVSKVEALSYYIGLPPEPTLLYRMSKQQWSLPRGSEAQRRLKELCAVFNHPITKFWNHELAWKIVKVMDAHKVRFTTIDVVRFKMVEVDEALEDEEEGEDEEEEGEAKKLVVSPVTIWTGVLPESTSATAAHDAAQDVLALLKDHYQITGIDIHFRESCTCVEVGPQLLNAIGDLDPLVDVLGPLTPALGLRISTRARPSAEGTIALYLAESDGSDGLLGLSCRHVLIGSEEANVDYVRRPNGPPKDVVLLGKRAFTKVVDSIKFTITGHGISSKRWRKQTEGFEEREKGTDAADVEKARAEWIQTQGLLDKAKKAMDALGVLLDQVNRDWKKLNNRVLGPIIRSPAIRLGVGEQRFTEDWGIFRVDRAKLGDGFKGNKMNLGTKLI